MSWPLYSLGLNQEKLESGPYATVSRGTISDDDENANGQIKKHKLSICGKGFEMYYV